MAAGDVYRLTQFFNIGSELTENVLHFQEVGSETDPLAAQFLIGIWHDVLLPLYAVDLFSSEAKCSVMHCIRIHPTAGVPSTIVFGGAEFDVIEGGNEDPPVPGQAAALISLYTTHFEPTGRGRTYWPGVANSAQNDGQLVAARAAELTALANAMDDLYGPAAPGVGTYRLCVWSRKESTARNVISGQGHSNLATIKGRRAFPGTA